MLASGMTVARGQRYWFECFPAANGEKYAKGQRQPAGILFGGIARAVGRHPSIIGDSVAPIESRLLIF